MAGRPDDGLPREQVFDFDEGGDEELDFEPPARAGAQAGAAPSPGGGLGDLAALGRSRPEPAPPPRPAGGLGDLASLASAPSLGGLGELASAAVPGAGERVVRPTREMPAPVGGPSLDLRGPAHGAASGLDELASLPRRHDTALDQLAVQTAPAGALDRPFASRPRHDTVQEHPAVPHLPTESTFDPDGDSSALETTSPGVHRDLSARVDVIETEVPLVTAADQAFSLPADPDTSPGLRAVDTDTSPGLRAVDTAPELADPFQATETTSRTARQPDRTIETAPLPLQSAADQAFGLSTEADTTGSTDAAIEDDALPLMGAADNAQYAGLAPAAASSGDAPPLASSAELALDLTTRQATPSAAPDASLEIEDVPQPRVQGTVFGDPQQAPGASLETEDVPRPQMHGTVFGGAPQPPAAVAAVAPAPAAPMPAAPLPAAAITGPTVEAARDLFLALDKAVKTLNLYEGRGDACGRSVAHVYTLLCQIVHGGELVLEITPYEFLLNGTPVYVSKEDRKGLSYRLFRDGLRELRLLPRIQDWELTELIEIMRVVQEQQTAEDDSVTLLWNKNLPGVRYEAIDIFLEGLLESDIAGFEEQLDALVADAKRPVHSEDRVAAAELRAGVDASAAEKARVWRERRLAQLRREYGEESIATVRGPLAAAAQDLWRRAISLIARLMQTTDQAAGVADLLGCVLEEMWKAGRWEVLASACRAIGEIVEQRDAAGQAMATTLQRAMLRICTPERVLSLQPVLEVCSVSQFHKLAELLRVVPSQVYPQLTVLLLRTPAGEVQDQLIALLSARGVDLLDFHRKRLQSANIGHVIAAIAALMASARPEALQAVRALLRHANSRVRLEALRALKGSLEETAVPQLVASLAIDHRELREICLDELERLPLRTQTESLLQVIKEEALDAWNPAQRKRLLQLAVRGGGPEIADFAVKRITAVNAFRRQKVEIDRQEMIEAVRLVGGPRGRNILEACLASRPSESTRSAVEAALKGMERK